jgi:hypothetical protein
MKIQKKTMRKKTMRKKTKRRVGGRKTRKGVTGKSRKPRKGVGGRKTRKTRKRVVKKNRKHRKRVGTFKGGSLLTNPFSDFTVGNIINEVTSNITGVDDCNTSDPTKQFCDYPYSNAV